VSESKKPRSSKERKKRPRSVSAGETIIELVHDLSNHLNGMVLQAACLQLKVAEEHRVELGQIRNEGVQAAMLLRSLQELGQRLLEEK
jgi:hypothetical protein